MCTPLFIGEGGGGLNLLPNFKRKGGGGGLGGPPKFGGGGGGGLVRTSKFRGG